MALNKNALIRYRTLDKCLQNHYRRWTLKDLVDACSEALHEYEGREISVSVRTVQLDIQLMRSDKLGYNAPIEVYERKFYRYSEEGFSITDIPLTETDMSVLSETVEMLKQFKDFSLFSDLGGIIQRLEDKVYTEKTNRPAIIHLDKNESLKGLHHLDVLYQSILKQIVLNLTYQSFSAPEPGTFAFHPFILKEFNNRWFLVGRREGLDKIENLALDRLIKIEPVFSIDYVQEDFNADEYYKNTFGVTVLAKRHLLSVELLVNRHNAPYVLTKPMHASQELLEKLEDGSIRISLNVHHNYELERLILGFGDGITVLGPRDFKRRIKWKLEKALAGYGGNDG